jgi:hypothetical protein
MVKLESKDPLLAWVWHSDSAYPFKPCGQQLAHPGPHRGDPASSSFVYESWTGGFLHAPLCGLASSCPSFPARDYPIKSLKTTWSRFDGGHWPLSDAMERHLSLLALTHERWPKLYSDPNLAVPSLRQKGYYRRVTGHWKDYPNVGLKRLL